MYELTTASTPEDISKAISTEIFGRDLVVKDIPVADVIESDIPDTPEPEVSEEAAVALTPAEPAALLAKSLPKSWKKELTPVWEKADPAIHDYVYQREEAIMRGLQQYSDGHKRWNEVIQPFTQVMADNPDIDPGQLFQTLMRNHVAVVQGSKPQKIDLLRNILRGYQIDPAELISDNPSQQTSIPPELQTLGEKVQRLESALARSQQTAYESGLADKTKQVEAFFADPVNKYVSEVEEDIVNLIKTKAADSLQSAYELACLRSPTVRLKVIADQQAQTPVVKPAVTNLDASGEVRVKRSKPVSWQDDVQSIVHKHYGSN